ncbi:NTE family protein [Pseudarcicella hirudinis]|uniref:NTE family protein n=1 Tax=Pseudarcicella hirudinis TaxID=1079859 RepID=A0A1I5STZ1_9BACT|nr:patatin-like phospholipase family protein [Pseudarcicella hirudinis]SFP74274.1 NTE family protein [Pseudarcicella hirudinis]
MKIGLVLSGGGARGFSHLGVLKGLLEQGIQPDMLSGCSAGSIAGAMFAAGYSPDHIFEIVVSNISYRTFRPALSRLGLFKIENIENLYAKYLPHNSFENLKIPLTINATDLYKGETEYFSSGELIKPILASCCIPGLFEPVRFNDKIYIDGGVLNNMPIEPLEGKCDFIIGSHCNPYGVPKRLVSMKSVIEKTLLLAINNNTRSRANRCDFVIEPGGLRDFDPFSISKAKELFTIGYEHTKSLEIAILIERQKQLS